MFVGGNFPTKRMYVAALGGSTGAWGDELTKLGALSRMPAALGGMQEQLATLFYGQVDAIGGTKHVMFGPMKGHLGRLDVQIPDPFDEPLLDSLVDQVRTLTTVDGSLRALQPSASAPCTPSPATPPSPSLCWDAAAQGDVELVPTERFIGPTHQTEMRDPCLPATPTPFTAQSPAAQYPANGCAVFADEGMPPLTGWGYGGEWTDAHAADRVPGLPTPVPVVFLADKATGAVHAFRSGLSEAEELDIFPGYDPSLPAVGYPGPDPIWPKSGDTIYPNAYFAGRSRIPNCWSVTSSPWPGEEDRDLEARRLVATVGHHDPGPSLFLAPWEWTGNPLSSKANGRFRYEPSQQDGRIHSRFPLPDAEDKDVQVTEDRVHVLMEGLDGTGPDALNTWWLVTFAKTGSVDSPGLDLLYCLQLETVGLRQELQRLKVSPDGRWICATFAHSAPGMMLLYTPDDEGGGLGAPGVVAGLRYLGGWQGWDRSAGAFYDLVNVYSSNVRGLDGQARVPTWPLPPTPQESGSAEVLTVDTDLDETGLSLPITSSQFFEADGELMLSLNTSPISIWRLDAGRAAGPASDGCPIAYVGCSASENCQRMRLGWTTKEGVLHLGDRGSFAWARCNPLVPDGQCPVHPSALP